MGKQFEAQESEDALSLSDLPLTSTASPHAQAHSHSHSQAKQLSDRPRRSSSEPQDFFEFLTDFSSSSKMCSADDIIICGKLVPLNLSRLPPPHPLPTATTEVRDGRKLDALPRRRCESLSHLERSAVTRSNSSMATSKLTRNSRSLDGRKLRRSSSSLMQDSDRNPSIRRAFRKPESIPKRSVRPRWHMFVFGIAKFPAEMELEDMKSRLFRKSPSTMFHTPEDTSVSAGDGGKLPVTRSAWKGSWKLIRALSCKGHASIPVTTPLACVPQV